jgi:periplasmic protein TonB
MPPVAPAITWLGSLSTLHKALAFSLLLHGAVLTVRFVDPERFNRVFADTPLEVVLVNTRSEEAPVQAQAIAQANLAGGGEAAQGRATSPLPNSLEVLAGDADRDAKRQVEALAQEQEQLLTQLRRELAAMPTPPPGADAGNPEHREQEERRRQLLKMMAQIEKRVNEENARPRKRYISPATREAVYALYYDRLRQRIEDRGTRDFPELAGRKLYGELVMNLTIDANGRLVDAEIVRASAERALDQRALAIARAAQPFGAFSSAMRAQADQIVVTSRFRFTREEGFETSLSAPR